METVDLSGVSCSVCGKTFKEKKNLYKHLRCIHYVEPLDKDKDKEKFSCEICNKMFLSKSGINNHSKKFHPSLPDHNYLEVPRRKTRLICSFEACKVEFINQNQYRAHLLKEHKLNIEMEEHCFESVQAFKQWKNDIQLQCLSYYTLDTAGKTLANGNMKLYYNCHHSLKYNSKGENKRAAKSMGSNIINKACPSRLEVEVVNDKSKVIVKYYKTHSEHETQIGRIILDKNTRTQIAEISNVKPSSTPSTSNNNNKECVVKKIESVMELFKITTLNNEVTKVIEKKLEQVIDLLNKNKEIYLKEVVHTNVQKKVAKQVCLATKRNRKTNSPKSIHITDYIQLKKDCNYK